MESLRITAFETGRSAAVQIRTVESFDLCIDGVRLEFEGRGPRKPFELLAVLISFGIRGGSVGAITDLLWPDAEGFDAYRALITTLHRLRRLLGFRQAVHFGAGRLRLEPTVCEIDAWNFERALNAASDIGQLDEALALYPGLFLGDDPNAWAIGMRARLEQAVARATRRLKAPAGAVDARLGGPVRQFARPVQVSSVSTPERGPPCWRQPAVPRGGSAHG